MSKKRAKWKVHLTHSNYNGQKEAVYPRLLSPETRDLNDLIDLAPRDLKPRQYLVRIVSQYTTNPNPMKQAAEYTTNTPLAVEAQ
ncbi:hypothetical protein [Bacteroides helcogenes]|uniref:Uncharacterized protein n=1 Tax=Bacteroides helcogenes (strain ATCC 35417 / DSM 20613 / JCM 6297 / CCUG 15421 / P 36-108) TaxID=693979 RepID=E6SVA7_BACT6|nr:hypothetical protein [Bacteroides helcogenes]ADV44473.1 hypothetical protein Bache_2508 [Bacteroides helcogenes P 36-108]MDY5237123.1 hypothetical protein [Bacteroides helcogenes]